MAEDEIRDRKVKRTRSKEREEKKRTNLQKRKKDIMKEGRKETRRGER